MESTMSIYSHSNNENIWHAKIFYALTQANVTPAELQEMAAQGSRSLINLQQERIRKILEKQGALAALPELARRCAIVPEVLLDRRTDAEDAIKHRMILCFLEDLITAGYCEVVGQGMPMAFRFIKELPSAIRSKLH
jgi:hypothetical protein